MADPAGPRPGLKITVIEVIEPFPAPGGPLAPGARLQAWRAPDGWRVLFNGAELRPPAGAVGELGSAEVKAAVERRSAREEEYQLAPKG